MTAKNGIHRPRAEYFLKILYSIYSILLLVIFWFWVGSMAPPSAWKTNVILECEVLLHFLLKALCSNCMVILFFYLNSASCLPSNKHHPWLAILLVKWKCTRDQWQGCCHGTVCSCWVKYCCKACESQSMLAFFCCNVNCLDLSTAQHHLLEASH